MSGLGYVFGMFSRRFTEQLVLNSPIFLCGIVLILLSLRPIIQKIKPGKRLVGSYIFVTLGAYVVFITILLLLEPSGVSYGAPFPVIFVFGGLYLVALGVGLLVCRALLNWYRARQGWRWLVGGYGLTHMAILGLLGYAFYIEPLWLDVTYTSVNESKIPAGTPPLKVALFSDIHMERWTRREDTFMQKLAENQPDIILISGDHINIDHYTPAAYADLKRFFSSLKAKYGVYAVMGGVDPAEPTRRAVEGTAVQLIEDSVTTIEVQGQKIQLTAIKSTDRNVNDLFTLRSLYEQNPFDGPRWLLFHTPELAPYAAELGIDFYWAGHTHGGQIALPFFGAVFTASRTGRTYAAGLYDLGGPAQSQLYVTRGLGMEGANMPRARLFARPELSIITINGTGRF